MDNEFRLSEIQTVGAICLVFLGGNAWEERKEGNAWEETQGGKRVRDTQGRKRVGGNAPADYACGVLAARSRAKRVDPPSRRPMLSM